ncbi:hypothetical protein T265_09994 [Opisthorchis viverrini]|uniref:Uncharacterized protein n=1 Tax=Opisthorchis viverrini TaxID=6198 RepID=A0A074ZEU8_OPIVI|nr:hypothetical protein T265_09994 [Opisthorchis viverrini]KER21755.1 hypothetical protein T265_09994 [Opisthorchis viverrini]
MGDKITPVSGVVAVRSVWVNVFGKRWNIFKTTEFELLPVRNLSIWSTQMTSSSSLKTKHSPRTFKVQSHASERTASEHSPYNSRRIPGDFGIFSHTSDRNVSDEVGARISKARITFSNFRHLWHQKGISLDPKGRVYQATVRAGLLYVCDTWPLRTDDVIRLQVFFTNDASEALLPLTTLHKSVILKGNRSAVAPFRCLTAMPPEGCTRAGYPSLDRGSREAEVWFEPRNFRSINSRSNHLEHLAPVISNRSCWCLKVTKTTITSAAEFAGNGFHTSLPSHCLTASGSLPPFTWLCEKTPSTGIRSTRPSQRNLCSVISSQQIGCGSD